MDFYNRHNRAPSILTPTDMPGFTHRESAQMAGILRMAEGRELPKRYRKTHILTEVDRLYMGQAALMLVLAD